MALAESNHNTKNFRYQFISGSCIAVLGIHVVDPHLFVLAGIAKDIWRVKDWASDSVVLTMDSGRTVSKISIL